MGETLALRNKEDGFCKKPDEERCFIHIIYIYITYGKHRFNISIIDLKPHEIPG